MGPGPSPVHPEILQAMAHPAVGHLDPRFVGLMDETVGMLRQVFETANPITFPVSGTGTAGMEAALACVVRPGDRVLAVVNGYFGDRMAQMASRMGADVQRLEVPWGRAVDPDDVGRTLRERHSSVVAAVHAETSTGIRQDPGPLARVAHAHGAVLVLDAVTSLGGMPVEVDRHGVDVAYSGSQKCLGAPPGLAPLTVSPDVVRAMAGRPQPASWYLDVGLVARYWGQDRVYHHTAPIHMVYALHRALALLLEEGLEARFRRHERVASALAAGLDALGLRFVVEDPALRLVSLTTVWVPEGIDDAAVRRVLLEEFAIEIGGGLGPLRGRIWRIGTMGESAHVRHVVRLLGALGEAMRRQGRKVDLTGALDAALEAAGS